jgi:hypothetical protein
MNAPPVITLSRRGALAASSTLRRHFVPAGSVPGRTDIHKLFRRSAFVPDAVGEVGECRPDRSRMTAVGPLAAFWRAVRAQRLHERVVG